MPLPPSNRPLSNGPLSNGPLKLALCTTELRQGGAEQCLVHLATRLDRERFSPVVYCLAAEPADPRRSLATTLRASGIPVHALGARRAIDAAWATRRLARHLKEQRCELVQTFLFHANVVGRLAARKASVPHIVSGIRVAQRRRGWYLWLDRVTSGCVDVHVCVSQAVAEFSRNQGGLPAERLVVIPNGVDVQRFAGAAPADLSAFGVAARRRVVTFAGRLDTQKGVEMLVEHSGRWLGQLPRHDLLVVGDGPLRRRLERMAQRAAPGRIHFAGFSDQVAGILAASDLAVLPSRWEGMPNIVLEAMAAGLPVAAFDVEGVRELLGPQSGSQAVAAGQPGALADRIVETLSDPQLAGRLGRENQSRARQHFSLEAMVAAYARLYLKLAGRE